MNRDATESQVKFDGGTPEDQARILELLREFWKANDTLDSPVLLETWSEDPDRIHFNSNGCTYYGLHDWLNIWDYYRPRFRSVEPGTLGDTRVVIRGDMAFVADPEITRTWEWIGEGEAPALLSNTKVRATMVYVREDGDWKVAHVHFSSAASGPRPDQLA